MEPRKEEQNKTPQTRTEVQPSRFRIVKLEERIAPAAGGGGDGEDHGDLHNSIHEGGRFDKH